jgi:hypothetical protein
MDSDIVLIKISGCLEGQWYHVIRFKDEFRREYDSMVRNGLESITWCIWDGKNPYKGE